MIRASFAAPCIGVGGADMLMSGLVKHATNINWTGATVPIVLSDEMIRMCNYAWNKSVPIHTLKRGGLPSYMIPHENQESCFTGGTIESDIIITWCLMDMYKYCGKPPQPIIEYVQNTDLYAQNVVNGNRDITHYQSGCSDAAIQSCFGFESDAKLIYNGIDPARVTPRFGRQRQREMWAIPDEAKVVLFLGRIVWEKHPELLIKALEYLPKNYVALFVGMGDKQPEMFDLAKRTAPGRVAFVKQMYHVGDAYAAADCFVLPSDHEGHPLALMEAMLAGVPCVYTDFEVMPELHKKFGELGVMLPRQCDPDVFADAILEATQERNGNHYRTSVARSTVWENFTITTIAAQWEEYIEQCYFDFHKVKRHTPIFPVRG